jgi:hypothetical protein
MSLRYLILSLCMATLCQAQVKLSKQRVLIGDTLSYQYKSNSATHKLLIDETVLGNNLIKADTIADGSIKVNSTLQPWYYGTYTFLNDTVRRDTFEVKPLLANQLFVDTPRVDLNKDIRDIVDYKEKRNYQTLIILGIIVSILLGLLLYVFSKIVKSDKGKNLPPLAHSLQLLENASTINVADKVQEALKYYLQHRLAIPALATTISDLQALLQIHSITSKHMPPLHNLLQQTDLIKYAQQPVSEEQCKQLTAQATSFIKQMEQQKIAQLEAIKKETKRNGR